MELLKFIVWLTIGAVIGWVAGRTVKLEHMQIKAASSVEDRGSE